MIRLLIFLSLVFPLFAGCQESSIINKIEGVWVWHENEGFCEQTNINIEAVENSKVIRFRHTNLNEETKQMEYYDNFYDVLKIESNALTLSMQGEDRKTDDGSLFVWILELYNNNTFLWKLSHWAKNIDNKSEKVWPYRRVRCS